MDSAEIEKLVSALAACRCQDMYGNDFLLTWDKTEEELKAIGLVSEILRGLRQMNISPRVFDSGLAVSLFRDNSTRTRFSFASACNMLGLTVQDLDEGKSQIAHGETVRETATMISFMSDVIGIRDDMYIGKGHSYMLEVAEAVSQSRADGILENRPTVVNLQCDIDHPTQTMADLQHLIARFGGTDNLKGKKIAMTWAYSPSYGKPLSVPQGIVGLLTRYGMDVVLAHPEGYEIMPAISQIATQNAKNSGGSFLITNSMAEAFNGADIVYPKSWAPFAAMRTRTELYGQGDEAGIKNLEKSLLAQNGKHKDWECDARLMASTRYGKALYMHCLPADISTISCPQGEVAADVFETSRNSLYQQASYKPYIIAAMIFMSKIANPATTLQNILRLAKPRATAG